MAVDSTLELFTTLFGWLFYNSIWDVLVATGLVFLPLLGLLVDTIMRSYASEDSEEAGNTTLRILEVEFFVIFFVMMMAAVPVVPLNAIDLSFTPRAIIGSPAQPIATVGQSQTTYGGGISFIGVPDTVDVPVFWFAVMSFSAGFNRAVMEAVPTMADLRGYAYTLRDSRIDDPSLTFKAKGGWPHSFPYSYVRSSRHTNEGITVKTQDAIVRIEGKDLEQLYGLIRRQKINEIALSPKQANDSGQSFVESISIHYIDEEITYE